MLANKMSNCGLSLWHRLISYLESLQYEAIPRYPQKNEFPEILLRLNNLGSFSSLNVFILDHKHLITPMRRAKRLSISKWNSKLLASLISSMNSFDRTVFETTLNRGWITSIRWMNEWVEEIFWFVSDVDLHKVALITKEKSKLHRVIAQPLSTARN